MEACSMAATQFARIGRANGPQLLQLAAQPLMQALQCMCAEFPPPSVSEQAGSHTHGIASENYTAASSRCGGRARSRVGQQLPA
jgi:hypothetical protein